MKATVAAAALTLAAALGFLAGYAAGVPRCGRADCCGPPGRPQAG